MPPRQRETNFIRLNPKLCKSCWICVNACSNHVFGKVDLPFHKHAKIVRASDCNGCKGLPQAKCVRGCKGGAITAKQPGKTPESPPSMVTEGNKSS